MLKEKLRAYILEEHMYGASPDTLDDDASLLDTAVFDSLAVMELIQFLEDAFDIKIFDVEFVPENLDSVNRICVFLASKGVSDGKA
jgi:acyl carrier protein